MTDLYLGIDVGGTTVKLGACDADGRVRARAAIATDPARGPDDTLDRIADAARALLAGVGPAAACGVGVPGPLDARRQRLLRANHFPGWQDVPIARSLADRLALPAVLENDANCAAWGEARAGGGRGAGALVLFTLGTGVGGGVVLGGRLWAGVGGAAGALGHLVVDPRGPSCGCGRQGCLEQYASAAAVARAAGRATAADAFAAAQGGDPRAQTAVGEACEALAAAAALIVHTLQPDVILFGGGMAGAGDALLGPVREGVARRVRPAWLAPVRLELAALGGDAGWVGAALWAAAPGVRLTRPGRSAQAR